MANNLINFRRGSQDAYDALKSADRIDPDTLYFIYDKDEKESSGFLYMGITPITGFGDILDAAITTVEVPDNVEITEYLNNNISNPNFKDLCVVNTHVYIYNNTGWVDIYDYLKNIIH